MTIIFFVNFDVFKWLYLAYYWVYFHQTWEFRKAWCALYDYVTFFIVELLRSLKHAGSSHGRGHCVVFLGKTLYFHGASFHPSLIIAVEFLLRAVRVRALAGDIVLCSWARHFTFTVPLSTQVYKWVLANFMPGDRKSVV